MARPRRARRDLTRAHLERMNLPPRYRDASLDRLHKGANHTALVHRYVRALDRNRRRGYGLLLYGPNGRGKTYSAAVLLKEAVARSYTGYFIQAADVKQAVVESWVFEETFAGEMISVEERMRSVDFLVIEDLGKEYKAASGFAENFFETLLRRRVQAMQVTIITTNMELSAFRDRYDRSTFELAAEALYPFCVTGRGRSERRQLAAEMKSDVEGDDEAR